MTTWKKFVWNLCKFIKIKKEQQQKITCTFVFTAFAQYFVETPLAPVTEIFDWVQSQDVAGPLKDIHRVVCKPLLLCA